MAVWFEWRDTVCKMFKCTTGTRTGWEVDHYQCYHIVGYCSSTCCSYCCSVGSTCNTEMFSEKGTTNTQVGSIKTQVSCCWQVCILNHCVFYNYIVLGFKISSVVRHNRKDHACPRLITQEHIRVSNTKPNVNITSVWSAYFLHFSTSRCWNDS